MSSESPVDPSSQQGNGWLPSNRGNFDEGGAAGGVYRSGLSEEVSGLWAPRGPEASAAPLPGGAAMLPTPRRLRRRHRQRPRRAAAAGRGRAARTFSALLAAVLIAGTAGGAAGSVLTANAFAAQPVAGGGAVRPGRRRAELRRRRSGQRQGHLQAGGPVRGRRADRGRRQPGPLLAQPPHPGRPAERARSGRRAERAARAVGRGHRLRRRHRRAHRHQQPRGRGGLRGQRRAQRRHAGARPGGRPRPDSDLALLKAALPANKVSVATLGDSDAVEPGDLAVAIGNPFGLEQTLTAGIVSAVNRDFGQAPGGPSGG